MIPWKRYMEGVGGGGSRELSVEKRRVEVDVGGTKLLESSGRIRQKEKAEEECLPGGIVGSHIDRAVLVDVEWLIDVRKWLLVGVSFEG